MTIDQRLDRLTQAHELLAADARALQVNIESLHSNLAQLFEAAAADRETMRRVSGDVDKLTGHMSNLTVTMDRLANIVIRHD
jgi:hypothetical protein